MQKDDLCACASGRAPAMMWRKSSRRSALSWQRNRRKKSGSSSVASTCAPVRALRGSPGLAERVRARPSTSA